MNNKNFSIKSLSDLEVLESTAKKIDIAKVFILYLVAANTFQIFGLYKSYPVFDSLWKAFVLISLLLYSVFKSPKPLTIGKGYWIAILTLISYQCINAILTNDLPDSFNAVMTIFFPVISLFIFMILLNKTNMNERQVIRFLKLFTGFVLFTCLFNFVVNYQLISSSLSMAKPYEINLSSFFDNRNTFGLYLALGAASNLFIIIKDNSSGLFKRALTYTTLLAILLNLALSLSRSSILLFFIFCIFMLIMVGKVRHYAITVFIVIILALGIVANPSVAKFLNTNIVRSEAGLSGRNKVYASSIKLLNSSSWLIGGGYNKSHEQLEQITGFSSTHNSYLAVLIRGGLVLFSGFIFALMYALRNILLIRKHDKLMGSFLLSIFFAYIIYSFAESQVIFFSSVTNYVVTVFVIYLPLYLLNNYKHTAQSGTR